MILNEIIKCGINSIDVEDESTISFYLPDGHHADMAGAIKIAKFICPDVKKIKTYSGFEPTISYVFKNDDWKSVTTQ